MSAAPDPALSPSRPPWQEPARGGYLSAPTGSQSGADLLRAMITGDRPRPPISHLTGMHITEVGEGTATFEMPLSEWLCSPQGAISIGPLTIPADAAMGCALQTVMPVATPFATPELSLRLLRPARPGGHVVARGRVIEARRTIALTDVAVFDEAERLLAHGSSLLLIQPQPTGEGPPPSAPPESRGPRPEATSPDPYERPVQGEVLSQEIWDRLSGIEVLRAQLSGELPMPPIHYLTGLRIASVDPEEVVFEMPSTAWLCAPRRERVQGGAVATLAESALSAALQARLPPRTALAPIDLKVNYLRPLAADGRIATATGSGVHAGRRIAVANAEVLNADGKPVAVATGSAMILPDRPASLGAVEG